MARPRKNNAEYFSHDSDMRNNRKIKALRAKHGVNGYAVFCMTLEMLTNAENFKVTIDDVEMELIAADFGFTTVELREIWNTAYNLRLITFENQELSCTELNERLQPVIDERTRQREKANKRWENTGKSMPFSNSTDVLPRENNAAVMQSKVKESKVKESKVKKDDKSIPEEEEFLIYAKTLEAYRVELDFALKAKYESWKESRWKDGNGKPIKNWKTKLKNTIPYLKPVFKQEHQKDQIGQSQIQAL